MAIRHRALLLSASALSLAAGVVGPATSGLAAGCKAYTGPADGSWMIAANWAGGTLPMATDDVCIPAGMGTIHVVHDSNSAYAQTLTSLSTIQVDATGELDITAPGPQPLDGTFIVDGHLSAPAGTSFTLVGGTLSGTGVINAPLLQTGGVLAPGGAGTVGTLQAIEGYTLQAGGELDIDVASDSSADLIPVESNGSSVGGTVRVFLLGAYQPAPGTAWTIGQGGTGWANAGATFSPAGYGYLHRTVGNRDAYAVQVTGAVAPTASLTAPARVVADASAKHAFVATCHLSAGTVARCVVVGKASGGTAVLATGSANGARVTVVVTKAGLKAASVAGGVVATLRAVVTPSGAGALPAAASTTITLVRKKAVLRVVSDVLFGFDSRTLSAAGLAKLKQVGVLLRGSKSLRCDGHTDNKGSSSYNQRLGLDRAKAVCAVLRAYVPKVSSRSFGESKPVVSNATDKGRARNRRVEIQVFN